MQMENVKPTFLSYLILAFLRARTEIARFNRRFRVYVEPFVQPILPSWSALKNRSRVQKVHKIGNSFVQLTLNTPRNWKGFRSGQYVQIGFFKDGAELRRCFSISSSPTQFKQTRTIELTIQVQAEGLLTPWIFESVKAGDRVTLSEAYGDFVIDGKKPALLIAGGSGFTPFQSFVSEQNNASDPLESVLLYYAKNPDLFASLDKWKSEKTKIHRFDTTQRGRFDMQDLEEHCPNFRHYEIYLCGPGAMIETLRETLLNHGCHADQIHFEYFGSVNKPNPEIASEVVFEKSGLTSQSGKNNLLELAESVGLKPDFGCRMGVCHQCKCSKKQGVVFNTRTQQYSEAGPEDIQLCVSVPVKDVVLDL